MSLSPFARSQIVWLHGKAEQYTDRNLISETQTLDPAFVQKLTPLLEATPLIVVGYRGAEPSIMESLLGAATNIPFRHGIYWCKRTGDEPHPNVELLAKRLGGNFQYLDIDGFDELLCDLNRNLAGVQRFAPQLIETPAQFDDQPVAEATWADVDGDLALTTLRNYCAKLERGSLDSQKLRPLMRELGLLVQTANGEHPSAACILLFGREPKGFFPQAVIAATVAGKKRRIFDGNLLNQHAVLLEWFEQEAVNAPIKVKGKRQHETRTPYQERAVSELLTNMIVHRDYAVPKPSQVDVVPNHALRFINPATPLPQSTRQLTLGPDGGFSRSPSSAICATARYAMCSSGSARWSEQEPAWSMPAIFLRSMAVLRPSPILPEKTVLWESFSGLKHQPVQPASAATRGRWGLMSSTSSRSPLSRII